MSRQRVSCNGTSYHPWIVSGYLDKKRIRRQFGDKEESEHKAREWAKAREGQFQEQRHVVVTRLTEQQVSAAEAASDRLPGFAHRLGEAVEFYLSHQFTHTSIPVNKALPQIIAAKKRVALWKCVRAPLGQ